MVARCLPSPTVLTPGEKNLAVLAQAHSEDHPAHSRRPGRDAAGRVAQVDFGYVAPGRPGRRAPSPPPDERHPGRLACRLPAAASGTLPSASASRRSPPQA